MSQQETESEGHDNTLDTSEEENSKRRWAMRFLGESRTPFIVTILFLLMAVFVSRMLSRQGDSNSKAPRGSATKRLADFSEKKKISGERKYEASGAAAVPNTNGILFVDDSKGGHVFFMPVSQLGEQDGLVVDIPLGVSVKNPEGITQFGSHFIVMGSLATVESNDSGGIATFDFEPVTQAVSNAVALTGMRKFLFDNVPELKPWADKTSAEGGLNIEGIAVDPDPGNPRVLLGLRGPLLNRNALVVPLKLRDRQAPLTIDNLAIDEPSAIQLNLNGQAIRDIQYDNRLKAFLIISGAAETEEKTDFTLWIWSGEADQTRPEARPQEQTKIDKKMKPEGVAALKINNREFVFLVGDANTYAKIDYISR